MGQFELNPASTGLLIIDMQNGFLSPDGTLGQEGDNVEGAHRIIPNVMRLIQECRKRKIHDFWSIQEHFLEDRTRESHKVIPHTKKRKVPPCLQGTWDAEIIDELKPFIRQDSSLIRKQKFSCFYQTNFEVLLRIKGIDTLIITGVTTPACVETTVREGYMRDYDLLIVEDCIGHYDDEVHRASLKVMGRFMGMTLTLDDLMAMFPVEPAGRTSV